MKSLFLYMPSMVFLLAKIPSIKKIFEKNPDGTYTLDALMYQDIIRYSVRELESLGANSEVPFKLWTLTEWLIANNHEIADSYRKSADSHMTKTNKVQARIGRIKRYLDDLIYLGLIGIHGRTKESKGDGTTILYSFTLFGLIIALLIMTKIPKKREKAMNFLYRTFQENFQERPSSLDYFGLLFIRKLIENKLFNKYVDALLLTAEQADSIQGIKEFFARSLTLDLNPKDSITFQKVKKESFDELNPQMKKQFMHFQKLEIESMMFGVSNNLQSFENTRFKFRADYSRVVTEGLCGNCNLYFVIVLPIVEYLKLIRFKYQTLRCQKCGKEEAIKIPSFMV